MQADKIRKSVIAIAVTMFINPMSAREESSCCIRNAKQTAETELFTPYLLSDDIEEDIEDDIEEDIEDDIEEDIEDDIEEDIEDDIEEDIEDDIEEDVEDDIEEDVEDDIEEDVEDDIEEDVKEDVEKEIEEEIEDETEEEIKDDIDDEIEGSVEDDTEDDVEDDTEDDVEDDTEDDVEDDTEDDFVDDIFSKSEALELDAVEQIGEIISMSIGDRTYRLFSDDWLILAEQNEAQFLTQSGLTVLSENKLVSLGKTLYKVRAPSKIREDFRSNLKLLREYRTDQRRIDFNHIYSLSKSNLTPDKTEVTPRDLLSLPATKRLARVGIVDTAIDKSHPSLAKANVEAKAFIDGLDSAFDYHGTAIAATLVSSDPDYAGLLQNAKVYVASVFSNESENGPIATTESIILGLDWLVQQDVKVINMSLAGAPSQILRDAIVDYCRNGIVIVAAVGNSGPHSPVMYPAGYDCVVGVTAINTNDRIYRRAVRGQQVDVASYGVNLFAPTSSGGYAPLTGTSFATPFVSAYLATYAEQLSVKENPRVWVEKVLENSTDLGEPGKDPIYGYGKLKVIDTWD